MSAENISGYLFNLEVLHRLAPNICQSKEIKYERSMRALKPNYECVITAHTSTVTHTHVNSIITNHPVPFI